MKNLPYYKGGTCEKQKYRLSFNGNLKNLEFSTYEEFCCKAELIFYTFSRYRKEVNFIAYKEYIYSKKLDDDPRLNNAMHDKCLEWILGCEYEPISLNDLYSLIGIAKKGKK